MGEEGGGSSILEVAITVFIVGILGYALYPAIQQLNPSFAPLFLVMLGFMELALIYGLYRRATGYE